MLTVYLIHIENSFNIHVGLKSFLDPVGVGSQLLDELTLVLVGADDHLEVILFRIQKNILKNFGF